MGRLATDLLGDLIAMTLAGFIAASCGLSSPPKIEPNEPGITTTAPNNTTDPTTTTTTPTSTSVVSPTSSPTVPEGPTQPVALKAQVLASYPHDSQAFTQGLLYDNGELFESTGQRGESTVRRVELETGEVLQSTDLHRSYFGEGLTRVGDRLIQLTWQSNTALVYDADTFELTGSFDYATEGWGICLDNQNRLVMSDGSATLYLRDPITFEQIGTVAVTRAGQPVFNLNELECVDGEVYANVWRTDRIVRIDPASGDVVADINAAGLLTPAERRNADVLNGIAYRPDTDTFLITGKDWPTLFEVTFE